MGEPLVCWKKSRNPRIRLICFPYAGGGSFMYKDWAKYIPDDVELLAVDLRGRGGRFNERLSADINTHINDILVNYGHLNELPLIVFGHSMGGLLGFEFSRAVKERLGHEILHFFPSASRAPQLPRVMDVTYNLSDDDFLSKLGESDGLPREIFESSELRDIFLPILRSDVRLCEVYCFEGATLLECPISVIGGTMDQGVLRHELETWREHTTKDTCLHLISAGHFYVDTHRLQVINIIMKQIGSTSIL
ncbi:Surfactin synthase thioesterase subunit [Pseudovibrio sp. Tun.PSC04-5.I4]|nr:Surfactin synthase thioesterase subunit [Pseudovibrio sp. Tun.PSC04-5.I4]